MHLSSHKTCTIKPHSHASHYVRCQLVIRCARCCRWTNFFFFFFFCTTKLCWIFTYLALSLWCYSLLSSIWNRILWNLTVVIHLSICVVVVVVADHYSVRLDSVCPIGPFLFCFLCSNASCLRICCRLDVPVELTLFNLWQINKKKKKNNHEKLLHMLCTTMLYMLWVR